MRHQRKSTYEISYQAIYEAGYQIMTKPITESLQYTWTWLASRLDRDLEPVQLYIASLRDCYISPLPDPPFLAASPVSQNWSRLVS